MNYFCVFDFETDSLDIATTNIVQAACIMIDPYTLDIVSGSKFYTQMRPENIDESNYLDKERKSTIDFHLKHRNISQDELLEEWRNSPPSDVAWREFVSHINKYNRTGKAGDCPNAAGMNVRKFDVPISNKYKEKYKTNKLFGYTTFDLLDMFQHWFTWDPSIKSYSLDSMRSYLGLSSEGAHNAGVDVDQEALVLQKFLKLYKKLSPQIKFRNCFGENE